MKTHKHVLLLLIAGGVPVPRAMGERTGLLTLTGSLPDPCSVAFHLVADDLAVPWGRLVCEVENIALWVENIAQDARGNGDVAG